ncbi:MAG: hypothetical protein A3B23_02345 [Candidatus Colwellbacteria bacterium RIFCSPLOWO2_01_FULL_48_10]|uniref:Uncharacterized protein n=1 Tax=Candidatus Colwellbacteria bacterium RIFCSPLOWO2_01_FULL_48_10 TaxID=1797690 RepID=A0A1G1Z5R6_9BACT|nr:MAG: hypothetical protein A3B23_02345 [Candidatus Colwellbacteria bacterium RIFCSPLOWO2_01_FULL_48_10]
MSGTISSTPRLPRISITFFQYLCELPQPWSRRILVDSITEIYPKTAFLAISALNLGVCGIWVWIGPLSWIKFWFEIAIADHLNNWPIGQLLRWISSAAKINYTYLHVGFMILIIVLVNLRAV